MVFPVMTAEFGKPSSASTKIPVSAIGVLAGPPRLRLEPEIAGMVLLVTLNRAKALAVLLVAAPFCPKMLMIVALGTSRIVLLLIVTTPCVACPCTTARMPLPNPEPESFTPCVPMMLVSILPTKE